MVRTRLFSLWQKIRFQAWPIEGPLLDKLTASLGLQVQDWLRIYLGIYLRYILHSKESGKDLVDPGNGEAVRKANKFSIPTPLSSLSLP